MQDERRTRQELQTLVAELREQMKASGQKDPLEGKEDDDTVTVGDVRKILAGAQNTAASNDAANQEKDLRSRAVANYNADEERLQRDEEAGKLDVPFEEAMKEFSRMAKKNSGLLHSVNQEARKVGGKPAELAYKLACTSPVFITRIKKTAREKLVTDLEREGKLKPRKLPSGGGPQGPLDAKNLSDEDLLNMSDEALDKAIRDNT